MRSVCDCASITHGVELRSTVFKSAFRSSIDTRVESFLSDSFHILMASAIDGSVRRMPSATAAEKMAAEADRALSPISFLMPGRAVTTYQTGFSQNCSVTRASLGILGSFMLNSDASGCM